MNCNSDAKGGTVMLARELKITNLDISEHNYDYRGVFTLRAPEKTLDMDMMELEDEKKILEIKEFFKLDEPPGELKTIILDMVMKQSMS